MRALCEWTCPVSDWYVCASPPTVAHCRRTTGAPTAVSCHSSAAAREHALTQDDARACDDGFPGRKGTRASVVCWAVRAAVKGSMLGCGGELTTHL